MSKQIRYSVIAVPFLLLGCQTMIDGPKLEGFIKTDMATHGVTMSNISCPTNVVSKAGATFQCTGKDDQGTDAIFDINVKDGQGNLEYNLKGKYVDMAAVTDALESDIAAKMGNSVKVDVTCPKKNIIVYKGAKFMCDSDVGGDKKKITFTFTDDTGAAVDWTVI